jgi:hypothetical protein
MDGSKPPAVRIRIGDAPNSYGISADSLRNHGCWLSGKEHNLECLTKAIVGGDVIGSGLMLNSKSELAIFFTQNGVLLGKLLGIHKHK